MTFEAKGDRGLFGFRIECFKMRVSPFFPLFYHMEFLSLWPSKNQFLSLKANILPALKMLAFENQYILANNVEIDMPNT